MTTPGKLLIVMAKWPEAGRVKTRLAPAVGAAGAARLYAAFLGDVLEESADRAQWELGVAFDPPEREVDFRRLAARASRFLPQRGPDLAARMRGVFADALATADRVVMRNSDSPTLPRSRLAEAFDALEQEVDVVVGPDRGGGYYLVGLRQPAPGLFALPMSTGSVLADTIARARKLGLRLRLLPPHLDVDRPDDLRALRDELAADASARARGPRTVTALREEDGAGG